MARSKFNYKKMNLDEMTKWVEENFEMLSKEKKEQLDMFLNNAVVNGKRKTLGAKKFFYNMAKDYADFEEAPKGKTQKEDKVVSKIQELRKKAGLDK